MTGAISEFETGRLCAFVRLAVPWAGSRLTEVRLPTRFIFILLGPPNDDRQLQEIGRSMATILNDEVLSFSLKFQ